MKKQKIWLFLFKKKFSGSTGEWQLYIHFKNLKAKSLNFRYHICKKFAKIIFSDQCIIFFKFLYLSIFLKSAIDEFKNSNIYQTIYEQEITKKPFLEYIKIQFDGFKFDIDESENIKVNPPRFKKSKIDETDQDV